MVQEGCKRGVRGVSSVETVVWRYWCKESISGVVNDIVGMW